jgi:hypothetical protein
MKPKANSQNLILKEVESKRRLRRKNCIEENSRTYVIRESRKDGEDYLKT